MNISWWFFTMAPFSLVCSGNGTGILCGFTFLMLGFLCKWIEEGGIQRVKKKKVTPEEFWENHFVSKYNSEIGTVNRKKAVKNAKDWADYVSKCNGATPPTDERYEEIAKKWGIKTLKELDKEEKESIIHNKITYIKYYYLFETISDYEEKALKESNPKEKEQLFKLVQLLKQKQNELCYYSGCNLNHFFDGIGRPLEKLPAHSSWRLATPEQMEEAERWTNEIIGTFYKNLYC